MIDLCKSRNSGSWFQHTPVCASVWSNEHETTLNQRAKFLLCCLSGYWYQAFLFILGHLISRHNLSSPPQSPASRDCNQQTVSACQSSSSIQDYLLPVSKSSVNLSVRTCASSSSQTSSKEQPLFTLSQVSCWLFVKILHDCSSNVGYLQH